MSNYGNDIEYLKTLHAHLWGDYWTKDYKIILLSKEHQKILLEGCEQINIDILKPMFADIWKDIDLYIADHGPVFFKLSSVSPKDVILGDNEPTLKAHSAEKIFNVFVHSFRVLEELDQGSPTYVELNLRSPAQAELDQGSLAQADPDILSVNYAIILTKWNDKISRENEYRCYIFNGICEAIAKIDNETEPDDNIAIQIYKYISDHLDKLPNKTIALDIAFIDNTIQFIEFNPIDEELDTYGILNRDKKLSDAAMILLARSP